MGRMGGEASAEIDAPIDEVWSVVEDVATAPAWQKGLEAMNVLERDGDGRVLVAESLSDAKVKTVKSRVRFAYVEPHKVTWTQEKGDLKSLVGSWTLEDLGGNRTRATYELDGDPGRMLGMLIQGPVEGRIREILVDERPTELKRRMASGR